MRRMSKLIGIKGEWRMAMGIKGPLSALRSEAFVIRNLSLISISGSYKFEDMYGISRPQAITTLRACPNMGLESDFLKALSTPTIIRPGSHRNGRMEPLLCRYE